jgi:hypothetical protein
LAAKHLRNSSEEIPKANDYFVLVYTDFSEENTDIDRNLNFMPPVTQKCIRKKSLKDDEFVVLFGDDNKNGNNS